MTIKMFSYQYEEYNEKVGALYETEERMMVNLAISKDECTLTANKEGLLALAKSLIRLADSSVPVGSHFHMDAPIYMKEGSVDLIIEKI